MSGTALFSPMRSAASRNRGFSLIELMVAMTLSIVVVTALVTLLLRNSRAHDDLDRSSRQIENGRYAMDVLSDDISLAGYFGEFTPPASAVTPNPARTTPDPCATAVANLGWSNSPLNAPVQVQGWDGGDAPTCVKSRNWLAGTHVLVVRRLSVTTLDPNLPATTVSSPALQTSRCDSDPFATVLIFSNKKSDFTLQTIKCDGTLSPIRTYVPRVYYISSCSDCASGDSIPTLKRLDYQGGALVETPIAEGVEDMRFEYGFDTSPAATPDGVPDTFRSGLDATAGSLAGDWSNVVAIRVWLVSRTTDPTFKYVDTKTYDLGPIYGAVAAKNDAFKRRVYTALVRLNNPAGQRE